MTRLIFPIEAFDLSKTSKRQISTNQYGWIKMFFKEDILRETNANLPLPYLEYHYDGREIERQLREHPRSLSNTVPLAKKELYAEYLGREYQGSADVQLLMDAVDSSVIMEKLLRAEQIAISREEIIINQGIEVDDSLLSQYKQIILSISKV